MKISLLSGSDATLQHTAVASVRYSFRGCFGGTFTTAKPSFFIFFFSSSLSLTPGTLVSSSHRQHSRPLQSSICEPRLGGAAGFPADVSERRRSDGKEFTPERRRERRKGGGVREEDPVGRLFFPPPSSPPPPGPGPALPLQFRMSLRGY